MADVILSTCLYILITFALVYLARIIYKVMKYRHEKAVQQDEEQDLDKQLLERERRLSLVTGSRELPNIERKASIVDNNIDQKRKESVVNVWGSGTPVKHRCDMFSSFRNNFDRETYRYFHVRMTPILNSRSFTSMLDRIQIMQMEIMLSPPPPRKLAP